MNKFNAKHAGKYRSKLEAHCAERLEWYQIPYAYEESSFELLDGFSFPISWEKYGRSYKQVEKVRPIKYIPDFVGHRWIIETKGVRTPAFNIKWKLFKNLIVEQNLDYDLFAPSNKKEIEITLEIIKNDAKYWAA